MLSNSLSIAEITSVTTVSHSQSYSLYFGHLPHPGSWSHRRATLCMTRLHRRLVGHSNTLPPTVALKAISLSLHTLPMTMMLAAETQFRPWRVATAAPPETTSAFHGYVLSVSPHNNTKVQYSTSDQSELSHRLTSLFLPWWSSVLFVPHILYQLLDSLHCCPHSELHSYHILVDWRHPGVKHTSVKPDTHLWLVENYKIKSNNCINIQVLYCITDTNNWHDTIHTQPFLPTSGVQPLAVASNFTLDFQTDRQPDGFPSLPACGQISVGLNRCTEVTRHPVKARHVLRLLDLIHSL